MTEDNKPFVKIIIAAHKKYQMPQDPMYLPVHVGAAGKLGKDGKPLDIGYVKDNTGQNISDKNSEFSELTGLYWAWKNVDAANLGLAHYRRHFSFRKKSSDPFENVLTSKEASRLLHQYKVIVPKKRNYVIETLYSHYAHTHYAEHLDITRKIITQKYPDYVQDFDQVMEHREGYMFNMFIMRRDLVNAYCQWLFDILFELEKQIGPKTAKMDNFQKRLYGRVSEIAFNVWLRHEVRTGVLKASDIKEVRCIYMEPIDWGRKISSFIKAKFFGQKYDKSF
ncbi:DUF4422 domain-containing protein [Lactobacillus delbrueckii]|uniref:DUF4422 domain-containing protein n=1 Tax=Lactobacillus delbrueckii TaxID=1584 RepID=UPI001F292819|nr:DUF4422 domain-containing protein [Lactobacillus delbrueckii]GHN53965.1 glycosyltransferase [Lactobacillus delbrueckii]